MTPYLTPSGKWVLNAAIITLGFGVAFSSPILVVIGQIQIALLIFSVLLVVPGALALDRRKVSIGLEQTALERVGTSYLVGEEVKTAVRVQNSSGSTLHGFSAQPFGARALSLPEKVISASVPPGAAPDVEFEVTGRRSGRFAVHGFDVLLADPMGLVEVKDYLPGVQTFQFFPSAGRLRRRARYDGPIARGSVGKHIVSVKGQGMELRELRDYHSGDALRNIAWKQSIRAQKLIAKDFEREISTNVYIALDISSSMRGGQWEGQKLEWGIHLSVDLAESVIKSRDRVGLLTFDEKLFGHIETGNSKAHLKSFIHHLMGLNSIVDEELTEINGPDLEQMAADYLLVQERLDFRKGASEDSESGVNRALLDKWVKARLYEDEKRYHSPVLQEGVLNQNTGDLRRFLQVRGLEVPYRVEARLGMKERGLSEVFDFLVRQCKSPHWLIIVSDLCGVLNPEALLRQMRLARSKGHHLLFVVPFTPAFYSVPEDDERAQIVHELFASAESDERDKIVQKIRAIGIPVDYVKRDREELRPFVGEPTAFVE